MNIKVNFLKIILIFIFISAPVFSQDSPDTTDAAQTTGHSISIEENTNRHSYSAKFFNRKIFELRATVNERSPRQRAEEFKNKVTEIIEKKPEIIKVTAEKRSFGYIINVNKVQVIAIYDSDFNTKDPDKRNEQISALMSNLETAIADYNEHTDFRYIKVALFSMLLAAFVLFICWRLIFFLRILSENYTSLIVRNTFLKFSSKDFSAQHAPVVSNYINKLINIVLYALYVFLCYVSFTLLLRNIPYTRPWSSELLEYLINGADFLAKSSLSFLPNILAIIGILVVAKYSVKFLNIVFKGIAKNHIQFPLIDRDTLVPTSRLLSVFIWIVAIGLLYPFIPGSGTDAFKSLSVLIGVMVSLGSTNIITQAVSGLILIYTKSMKAGDWVKINDSEGEVLSMGAFTVHIITVNKEEISLPNSFVLNNATVNYTKQKATQGIAIYTNVTAGYDVPKEKVEEMLFEAAKRTKTILQNEKTMVWITNFDNYAVEYRLTVWLDTPNRKGPIKAELNGNIFDVFNENGIELMTPSVIDLKK